MPSGFKTYSASIQVDLDDILKPIGVSTPRNNVGFKVGATDISQRYKAYTTDPSKLPFNTFFKSGSVDLGQLFMAYNFIEGVFYTLTVYSGSGGGSKESASLAPITASAAPSHYSFDTWIGSGITSPSSAQTTVLMDAAKTVSASYDISQYILTVTDGTGDGTFGYFDDMPITASAAPSYKTFNNWSNTAGSLSFVNSALAQTIANFTADGNATAAAIYDWILYNVQANNGSGGSTTLLDGDSSGGVLQLANNNNEQYSLIANPQTHYHFTSWSGNTGGIVNVNAASTYIVVTGNATVTSNFALDQYTLTVVYGSGGGLANYGNTYNIAATVYTGYTFTNWQTNVGTITYGDVNDPTTTATIGAANATTEAIYDINQYTLTVVDGTGGGLQNYNHTYTINATDYTGYTFANWQVNAGSVSFANQYADTTTCTIGAANATVESNYNINQYTLTVVYGTGGGSANYENVYNIVAGTYTGYTFTNWQTNAGSISYGDANDPTTTATIGAANATTEAIYSANPYTLTVVDGTGGGTQNYADPNGYVYTITADNYEPAYTFTNWTGAGITFANANSSTTTCTIGAANRTATANYVEN